MSEIQTIEERVKHCIAYQMGLAEDEVKNESSLVNDLGCDSLDSIEIIMEIEDEFGMEISDDDAERLRTVQQAIDYVTAKVA